TMKAMILLGVNCGYGPADCGRLKFSNLDLEKSLVKFPRPKTGVPRRCFLWKETIEAIRAALAERPEPKHPEDNELVFINRLAVAFDKEHYSSPISNEFLKLMRKIGLNGNRGFYALRHTFETIGGASRDQIAVNEIMGHADGSMAATYREHVQDERLQF